MDHPQNTLVAERDDATLVAQSRAGDADAFAQIVVRYQSLICALTFSATGSKSQSEDLAQETFVVAWKKLGDLRETEKLRAWLCAIARNLCLNLHRSNQREPTHQAETLAKVSDQPLDALDPAELAMQGDEAAIVWRALAQIPELYREPLVLFYRQHKSIEHVAVQLELSEEVVRQRLSRGRKLLSEKVEAMVEVTLTKTGPGRAFTTGVMSALPMMIGSAKSAAVASAMATGGTAFKTAVLTSWAGAILGPIVGLLGGWLGFKVSVESSNSSRERSFKIKSARRALVITGITVVGQMLLVFFIYPHWNAHPLAVSLITVAYWLGFGALLGGLILHSNFQLRKILLEEGTATSGIGYTTAYEYRSRWTLLGWPLIHINSGMTAEGRVRVARGWIAIGDMAIGGFALGGVSAGVISLGGMSIGLISSGGVAVGLVALAGLAIGGLAMGGMALGYYAYGGTACAWRAAFGGQAIAHDMAVGGSAIAPHANDAVATAFINTSPYFPPLHTVLMAAPFIIWAPMLLVVWQAIRMSRAKKSMAGVKLAELFGRAPK
jgi:RNA polymerase sigma factor (sigma-70 family)